MSCGNPFVANISKEKPARFALTNRSVAVAREETSSCIFDDTLFSMTPEAKKELKSEIESEKLHDAVGFVRHGGWWSCAMEGKECKCAGNARMVNIDRVQLSGSKIVDAGALKGSVLCSGESFGAKKPAEVAVWPSPDRVFCECQAKHGAKLTADGFHLEKRFSSKSNLQEAWIFLLRLLSRTGQIPMGTGDKTYSGMDNWSSRGGNLAVAPNDVVVLERFWLIKYTREVVAKAVQGPRCLEWGNPEKPGTEFVYSGLVAGCTQKYDLQFDYIYWRGAGKHVSGNVVHSDILSLPDVLASQGLQMDAIFATQVFEHLAEPFPAAEALYRATAPNGVVIVTAPQQAPFHKVPHDYYRYTVEGMKYMLVKAGFCVPNAYFVGGGDFVFDIARDAGLLVQDFSMEEVEAGWQVGYDSVSHSAITIHALAFKPPHAACQDPTAGWAELARQGIRAL